MNNFQPSHRMQYSLINLCFGIQRRSDSQERGRPPRGVRDEADGGDEGAAERREGSAGEAGGAEPDAAVLHGQHGRRHQEAHRGR